MSFSKVVTPLRFSQMVRIWSVRLSASLASSVVMATMTINLFRSSRLRTGLEVCEHEIEMQKKYLVGGRLKDIHYLRVL